MAAGNHMIVISANKELGSASLRRLYVWSKVGSDETVDSGRPDNHHVYKLCGSMSRHCRLAGFVGHGHVHGVYKQRQVGHQPVCPTFHAYLSLFSCVLPTAHTERRPETH